MESTDQILLIILGSALAVFLILGIIAITKIIQVLESVKKVSEKLEKLADNAGTLGQYFKYTAGPAAAVKIIANIGRSLIKHKKDKE